MNFFFNKHLTKNYTKKHERAEEGIYSLVSQINLITYYYFLLTVWYLKTYLNLIIVSYFPSKRFIKYNMLKSIMGNSSFTKWKQLLKKTNSKVCMVSWIRFNYNLLSLKFSTDSLVLQNEFNYTLILFA